MGLKQKLEKKKKKMKKIPIFFTNHSQSIPLTLVKKIWEMADSGKKIIKNPPKMAKIDFFQANWPFHHI